MQRLPLPTLFAMAAVLLASSVVAGCDRIAGGDSETKLANVEVQPGTASDEMITLDDADGDGTAIDPGTAISPEAAEGPLPEARTAPRAAPPPDAGDPVAVPDDAAEQLPSE